jgi:hypothetical protein
VVTSLLERLKEDAAVEHLSALLARDPAAQIDLDYATDLETDRLLRAFREVGADGQVRVLLDRLQGHISFTDPGAVAFLLSTLATAGSDDRVAEVLTRLQVESVEISSAEGVAALIWSLNRLGAVDQIAGLLARAPAAHVPLDCPRELQRLLEVFRELKINDQIKVLLARAPATRVDLPESSVDGLDNDLIWFLRELKLLGMQQGGDQFELLCKRTADAGLGESDLKNISRFRYGRDADGNPLSPWGWSDLS